MDDDFFIGVFNILLIGGNDIDFKVTGFVRDLKLELSILTLHIRGFGNLIIDPSEVTVVRGMISEFALTACVLFDLVTSLGIKGTFDTS